MAVVAGLLLAACGHAPPPEPDPPGVVRLRCDDGARLRVTFAEDEARLVGLPLGDQTLLRDAGGGTPQQSVFGNAAVRAEFGLDADAGGAQLHLLAPPAQTLHCRRE